VLGGMLGRDAVHVGSTGRNVDARIDQPINALNGSAVVVENGDSGRHNAAGFHVYTGSFKVEYGEVIAPGAHTSTLGATTDTHPLHRPGLVNVRKAALTSEARV
jgi:hypothetical protein